MNAGKGDHDRSMRPFVITNAREELLPQIQKIEQQSFSVPWTETMLRLQLEPDSHNFLTAEAAGDVIGYIGMMYVHMKLRISVEDRLADIGIDFHRIFEVVLAGASRIDLK